MPYNKDYVEQAKKKGIFEDNVFDPKVLELSDEEKERMQKELLKISNINKDNIEIKEVRGTDNFTERKKKDYLNNIELNLFEKIIIFILSILNLINEDEYKLNKAIRSIENELSRIKPPIFNFNTRKVTKYFAYKIHDLYLRTVFLRNILDTVFDSNIWDNINSVKTGIEILFELLSGINSDEVDSKFSRTGLVKIISDYDNSKSAMESIEKMLNNYGNSIDKSIIENVNKIYTNIIYFKNFFEFEFNLFFRKFDPYFNPGSPPNFNDVFGNVLVEFLEKLEEAILNIDLQLDNFMIFKNLYNVSKRIYTIYGKNIEEHDEVEHEERIKKELLLINEIINDIIYKRYITLLIQAITKNPLYTPNIIHNQYDFYKLYSETIQKRVKYISKKIIKEKIYQKIENIIKKVFPSIKWAGIYDAALSKKLEDVQLSPFVYHYHTAVLLSFIRQYYDDFIKTALNLLLVNGSFMEKHFYRTVSDIFYNMDKYDAKIIDFIQEYSAEGTLGKKFLSLLAKYDSKNIEIKKVIERNIVSMNGKAKDIFDEFYNYFVTILDIISKVFNDIESKPPKYVRNIKTIGGLKNNKFISIIQKSYDVMMNMKELMNLLKESV